MAGLVFRLGTRTKETQPMTPTPAGRPITKADIEAKLAEIGGEVDGQVAGARHLAITAGVVTRRVRARRDVRARTPAGQATHDDRRDPPRMNLVGSVAGGILKGRAKRQGRIALIFAAVSIGFRVFRRVTRIDRSSRRSGSRSSRARSTSSGVCAGAGSVGT